MVKYLLIAYIFFVSWTGAFALSPWFRLHFLVALVAIVMAAIAAVLKGRFSISPYKQDDIWILLFLLMYILAAQINPNGSSFAYISVYLFVLIGLFLVMKGALFTFLESRQIYAANLCGVAFVGAFLSINFILNTNGIVDLQGMIPRLRDTTASYAGIFIRGYGFSTEPGIVAYYLNTLGPLALWYLWSGTVINKITKLIITSLIIFGWVVTFSAGGVFALLLSLVLSMSFLKYRRKEIRFKYTNLLNSILIIAIFVVGISYLQQSDIDRFLRPIYMKLTFSEELNTATNRIERYEAGYSIIMEKPLLGNGPGYFSSINESSTVNWYLMVIAEGGLLTIIPIIMFLSFVLYRIIKFQHSSRFAVLVGFIAACVHLAITTTSGYLHPFIWLLLAIFYAQMAHHDKIRRQEFLMRIDSATRKNTLPVNMN